MQIIRALVLLACITSFSSVYATLIESDLNAPGDGLLTIDTATGLEWLDVVVTLGLSFNQANASDFVTLQGFRHATESEMQSLFTAANLTNSPIRLAENYAGAVLLVGLMGPGTDAGNLIYIEGWYDAGGVYSSVASIDYAKDYMNGRTAFGGFFFSRDSTNPPTGNFLVRAVAEPATLALLGLGLAGLGFSRRKQ